MSINTHLIIPHRTSTFFSGENSCLLCNHHDIFSPYADFSRMRSSLELNFTWNVIQNKVQLYANAIFWRQVWINIKKSNWMIELVEFHKLPLVSMSHDLNSLFVLLSFPPMIHRSCVNTFISVALEYLIGLCFNFSAVLVLVFLIFPAFFFLFLEMTLCSELSSPDSGI